MDAEEKVAVEDYSESEAEGVDERDLPAHFYQLPQSSTLKFDHLFVGTAVPRNYIKAKDCDVLKDEQNIRQWHWSTGGGFIEAEADIGEIICWASPEDVFNEWNAIKFSGRRKAKLKSKNGVEDEFDAWRLAYSIKKHFMKIIITEFNHRVAKENTAKLTTNSPPIKIRKFKFFFLNKIINNMS
jgi:hypothetical protein